MQNGKKHAHTQDVRKLHRQSSIQLINELNKQSNKYTHRERELSAYMLETCFICYVHEFPFSNFRLFAAVTQMHKHTHIHTAEKVEKNALANANKSSPLKQKINKLLCLSLSLSLFECLYTMYVVDVIFCLN